MDVSAPLRWVDRYQRAHRWLALPFGVAKRFGESGAGLLAASIAYYGFFSLFPLLMVLASIAGLVLKGRGDLQEQLVRSALAQFPVIGTEIRAGSIEGSGVAVAFGLALALWAGLGAVRATQVAMDTVWDVPRKRRPAMPVSIGRASLMLVILGVFVVGAAVLSGAAAGATGVWEVTLSLLGSVVINVAMFAVAYRLLTSASLAWRDVLPGAVLAGVAWTVLLAAGGFIIEERVASASDVYGTFAIVIGLLGWIYLGAQITLIGAELNVVLSERLWPRSLQGSDVTDADERALRRSARQEERRDEETVTVAFETNPDDPVD